MDTLFPVVRPQQPVLPYWMGEGGTYCNELWEVVQGDALVYFVEMYCSCPTLVPDITGYQFRFSVKQSLDVNDPDEMATVLWTELHGLCGYTCLIVIPDLTARMDSGRYAFDFKYRTPSNLVETIRRGQLNILPTASVLLSLGEEVPPATAPGSPGIPIGGPIINPLMSTDPSSISGKSTKLWSQLQRQAAMARLTS